MTQTLNEPLLQRIASRLPYLPKALQQVADYVLAHPDESRTMTITTLAKAAGVAESTVSRFTRELDLPNYQALRLGIAESTFANRNRDREPRAFVYDGVAADDSIEQVVAKVHHSSSQTLDETVGRLDRDHTRRATELIKHAATLVFVCMGSSSIAAEEGVMRFTRAGKKCLLYRDQSVQAMLATIVGPEDVVIAISDSGQSTAVVEAVRAAHAAGAPTIAVTSDPTSRLAALSDVALFTATVPSGGALYGEAVTAKWSQLLVIDILYAGYAVGDSAAIQHHLQATYAAGIKHSRS